MHVGWSDGKSKAHDTFNIHSSLEMGGHEGGQPHSETGTSITEAEVNKESDFRLSLEDGGDLSKDSSEEAAAQDPAEHEEEWEDEEDDEESEG